MKLRSILLASAFLAFADPAHAQTGFGNAPGQGYAPTSTGTTPNAQRWMRGPFLNVLAFGAVCDGTTDDTTAIQAAITASQNSNGIPVYLPAFCHTTAALSITNYTHIFGNGLNSGLKPTVGIDAIDINTTAAITLENFSIQYPSAASNGTVAINVTASSGIGENVGSLFSNIFISFPNYGYNFLKASKFTIRDGVVSSPVNSAVAVANSNVGDSGDSTIYNNQFGTCGGPCIFFASSGGLRIISNKINVAPVGIQVALGSGIFTTGLYITGNSIEGIGPAVGLGGSGAAIQLGRAGTTGFLYSVIINGNEMTGNTGVSVPHDATAPWLIGLSISGGTFQGNPGISTSAINIDSVLGFNVGAGMQILPSLGGNTFPVITGAAANYGVVALPACTVSVPTSGSPGGTGTCSANSIASTNTTSMAPRESPTFSGTVTLPDGAIWTSSGLSSLLSVGTAKASTLFATGDAGGLAGAVGLSNGNSGTISTGVGSVKMSTANPGTNTAWIKVYIGTSPFWIPVWTTNAP